MTHKFFFLAASILFFFSGTPSCGGRPAINEPVPAAGQPSAAETYSGVDAHLAADVPPEPDYVTIIAAGDNLYHDIMIRAGEDGDYESFYSEIRPIVQAADIAFINQETLVAGEAFGFTGYPQFNSPQNAGRAVVAAGFNVINQANNHTMDKGEKAVFATMDFWDTIPGITVLGIHRSQEQRDIPKLIIKNNITLGFLSYTYGTNGIPVPSGKPWLVSLINREIIAKEIDALRPLCDVLVVSMHWGEEYQDNYNRNQTSLAAFLAEHQVDLVIGHHPHVLQPVEYIERTDGRTTLCFYSLGNLISAQVRSSTLLGALAYIRIKKISSAIGDGETKLAINGDVIYGDAIYGDAIVFEDAGAIPVVTHYEGNYTGFKVYPLYAYTEELAKKHRRNQNGKEVTLNGLGGAAERVLKDKLMLYNPFE